MEGIMKKLLYGFIISLMLFSYADAQIATDQIYGGVYTKAEVDDTVENAIAAIPETDLSNYYTKAQTEATVETIIYDKAQAKYWYPANMANGDYTGEIAIMSMAASCDVYNLLYMTSSGMNKAQGDTYAHLPVIGMCVETGTGSRKVLLRGLIKNTSWSFTVGARLYCSAATAGLLTATAPTTAGTQLQIVAIAIASDVIYFNPDLTVVEN